MAVRINHDVVPGTLYFNLIAIFTNQSFLSWLLRQARHILDRFCFGLRLLQAPN